MEKSTVSKFNQMPSSYEAQMFRVRNTQVRYCYNVSGYWCCCWNNLTICRWLRRCESTKRKIISQFAYRKSSSSTLSVTCCKYLHTLQFLTLILNWWGNDGCSHYSFMWPVAFQILQRSWPSDNTWKYFSCGNYASWNSSFHFNEKYCLTTSWNIPYFCLNKKKVTAVSLWHSLLLKCLLWCLLLDISSTTYKCPFFFVTITVQQSFSLGVSFTHLGNPMQRQQCWSHNMLVDFVVSSVLPFRLPGASCRCIFLWALYTLVGRMLRGHVMFCGQSHKTIHWAWFKILQIGASGYLVTKARSFAFHVRSFLFSLTVLRIFYMFPSCFLFSLFLFQLWASWNFSCGHLSPLVCGFQLTYLYIPKSIVLTQVTGTTLYFWASSSCWGGGAGEGRKEVTPTKTVFLRWTMLTPWALCHGAWHIALACHCLALSLTYLTPFLAPLVQNSWVAFLLPGSMNMGERALVRGCKPFPGRASWMWGASRNLLPRWGSEQIVGSH